MSKYAVTAGVQSAPVKTVLYGPEGIGKSTLFKAIAGVLPFTSGEISQRGRDCSDSHDLIGYVPQQNAVDWNFPASVGDVVMMGRARQIGWFRWPSAADWKAVQHALDQVGMLKYINRRIGRLSGGQKQRVFIARALTQAADVLLLDEPFNGVDVTATEEILDTLDRLRQDGVTVLVATHDVNLIRETGRRCLTLDRGGVLEGLVEAALPPQAGWRREGGIKLPPRDEDSR